MLFLAKFLSLEIRIGKRAALHGVSPEIGTGASSTCAAGNGLSANEDRRSYSSQSYIFQRPASSIPGTREGGAKHAKRLRTNRDAAFAMRRPVVAAPRKIKIFITPTAEILPE